VKHLSRAHASLARAIVPPLRAFATGIAWRALAAPHKTGLAAALLVFGSARVASALQQDSAAPQVAASNDEDAHALALAEFGAALGRWRSGASAEAHDLLRAGEKLAREHARPDALDVARFYASLPREERQRGWEAEQHLSALREVAYEAGQVGLRGEAWALERERLLEELAALIETQVERADTAPAAGALSVSALLRVQQAEAADAPLAATLTSRAEHEAQQALELFTRLGQRTPRLEPLVLLGRCATLRSDHLGATLYFERCEQLARELRRDDFRELALQGRVRLAQLEGDAPRERALLEQLAGFRTPKQSWSVARDWGARLLAEDHGAEAARFLERYEPGAETHAGDREEWNLLVGSARLRNGELRAAREHFERIDTNEGGELGLLALASLALYEQRESEVLTLLEPERVARFSTRGAARAQALLGEAHALAGDLNLAREHLQSALDAALEWEQRSFGSRSSELEAPTARAAGSVIGERLGLHSVALLADVLARGGEPLEAVRVIEDSQSRSLRRGAGALTRDALLEWAGAYELGLLTWVVGADFSFAAHLAPDGEVSWARIPRGRRALGDAVRRLREALLGSANDAGARARCETLARSFLAEFAPGPVAEGLRRCAKTAGHAPRLLLGLHGPLEAAPLEALPWSTLCGADVALAALAGLPSARVGPRMEARELERWALLGGPLDRAGAERLPGARFELAAALEVRPQSRLELGAAFGRGALETALRGRQPLHLATHLVEQAGEWRLEVSPGEHVSLAELAALRPAAPLAVLSTCSSGDGAFVDAEGLFGLARAFLDAGSRNVVVTLWPVEDAAAAHFGASFHRALAAQSEQPSPARACAAAREELRRAGFASSDWAAFRLLGRD